MRDEMGRFWRNIQNLTCDNLPKENLYPPDVFRVEHEETTEVKLERDSDESRSASLTPRSLQQSDESSPQEVVQNIDNINSLTQYNTEQQETGVLRMLTQDSQ